MSAFPRLRGSMISTLGSTRITQPPFEIAAAAISIAKADLVEAG